jgi:hypothetical protein
MAPLRIDADDTHLHLIAILHHILHALDAITGQKLRDVDQPAKAEEVHERAVRRQTHHPSKRNRANPRQRPARLLRRDARWSEAIWPPAAKLEARAAQRLLVYPRWPNAIRRTATAHPPSRPNRRPRRNGRLCAIGATSAIRFQATLHSGGPSCPSPRF